MLDSRCIKVLVRMRFDSRLTLGDIYVVKLREARVQAHVPSQAMPGLPWHDEVQTDGAYSRLIKEEAITDVNHARVI